MKKIACYFAFLFPVVSCQAADIVHVAISQSFEHPALNKTYQGIVDELAEQGFHSEKLHLSYEIARDNVTALQIAEKFVNENPTVIVAIATSSAQAAQVASHGKIPIVFAGVTDPIAAKLVSRWEKPEGNITGISDKVKADQTIKMIKRILPNLKSLGTVYNPEEENSANAIMELAKYGVDHRLKIVLAPARKPSEVLDAVNTLVGKVDGIYITLDNTVASAFESVVQLVEKQKIPVFTSDANLVSRGAVASIGFNYEEVGHLAGKQVARILKGEKVGDIHVISPQNMELVVNVEAAKKVGLTLSDAVLKEAKQILGSK